MQRDSCRLLEDLRECKAQSNQKFILVVGTLIKTLKVEIPLHFFLECNTHHAHRQIMLANLLKLNPKLSSATEYLQFIVNGSLVGSREQQMKINI